MRVFSSLRSRATLWVVSALLSGIVSASLWFASLAAWERHLQASYIAGLGLFETVRGAAPADPLLDITILSGLDANLASAGLFSKLPDINNGNYVTQLSLSAAPNISGPTHKLSIAVMSSDLQYPVAKLESAANHSAGAMLASLTKLLASYCSNPIVFVQHEAGPWHRIDGNAIWGCDAAPMDMRVPAILLALVSFSIILTFVMGTSAAFENFAAALGNRGVLRAPDNYPVAGPNELRSMIDAINFYQETQRQSISKRAMFLSGVSHDLGTPATRLRFRTQNLPDGELRDKMNADIDQMTSMIASVLAYTQSEVNLETPRLVSLVSMVQSIVDDFTDDNKPVQFTGYETPQIVAQTILFNRPKASGGKKANQQQHEVVIHARPLALQRALINIIENALKYGRKASVSIEATSQTAKIHVDDYGDSVDIDALRALTAPFKRGDNAENVQGFGIGLAIAVTVLEQHGGTIEFNVWSEGTRVTLTLPR